jgi:glycosyltransferase involved in cell wall biosynthesis
MCERLKASHKLGNIRYLGNVVNLYKAPAPKLKALASEEEQLNVVFIGSDSYKAGAEILAGSLAHLPQNLRYRVELHFIGTPSPAGTMRQIHSYGYLDKANPGDRQLYYDILQKAHLFVNPCQSWGAFSACVEAMYFHTPVVVCPYGEFAATFGEQITFGKYLEVEDAAKLAECISWTLNNEARWNTLSQRAHESVANFLWETFMTKFAELLK